MSARFIFIAAILLAAMIPAAPIVICAVLVTLALFAVDAGVIARRVVVRSDVQPVSLLALARFRAPPSHAALV